MLRVLNSESLLILVKTSQATEKKHKSIIYLDLDNPDYLEISKRTRILKPKEISNMVMQESVIRNRRELILMFPETEASAYHTPVNPKQTWIKSKIVGDLVPNVLQK